MSNKNNKNYDLEYVLKILLQKRKAMKRGSKNFPKDIQKSLKMTFEKMQIS